MHLCLFEDDHVAPLFPLTRTRAAYALRLGVRTVLETTREAFGAPPTLLHARPLVAPVMAEAFDLLANRLPEGLGVLFVNGRYVAEAGPLLERLRGAAQKGEPARAFVQPGGALVAAWVPETDARLAQAVADGDPLTPASFADLPEETVENATLLRRPTDLLDALRPALLAGYAARVDYNVYERPGADVQEGARLVGGEDIFIAPGAVVRPGAVVSAEDGPIYIGEDAVVMENAVVKGPLYLGPKAQVKPAAVVSASAVGYYSKVGGEVQGSIFQALSNKGHDGYLGDSYLGRWCNLGAGTNTSNLKNDYGEVTLYNASTEAFEPTGRQFAGLFMGDHSKCGIGTIFNTGTAIEPVCNLYGAGFPPRYVPPFSWGSPQDGFSEYRLDKALRVAEAVMARRSRPLTDAERELLAAVAAPQSGEVV